MVEMGFNAVGAEGALKGADSGIQGVGGQVAVTPFTVRAKFQHLLFLVNGYISLLCQKRSHEIVLFYV